jgi:hypothetical protein
MAGKQGRLLSTITTENVYCNYDPVAELQFQAFQTNSGDRNQRHATHE